MPKISRESFIVAAQVKPVNSHSIPAKVRKIATLMAEVKQLRDWIDEEIADLFATGVPYRKVAGLAACSVSKVQGIVRSRGLQRNSTKTDVSTKGES
jgi:hypothetical protein